MSSVADCDGFPGWSARDRVLAPVGVALILFASFAFFWQARDWNSASRLMLAYALVDQGTIRLDDYRVQTNDIARIDDRYYTDKQPGYSLVATIPYTIAKLAFGVPDHPIGGPALRHWPGDYWATLGTAGLATAIGAAVLVILAGRVGCGPRASALVGLAYGLATPAYAYATMSYGHQLAAACLLGSLALIDRPGVRHPMGGMILAGILASYASVVELSVGPISAILAGFVLAKVLSKGLPARGLGMFAVGALGPALILMGYNLLAFGSPFDIGYAHHATEQFAQVHSEDNPLGLRSPDWSRALPLLWGRYRGLFFYAPVLLLAVPGWVALMARRRWGLGLVALLASVAVFVINVSYPEWTGGWSTGPRLLVPLLPFGMIGVAGLLAVGGRWALVPAVLLVMAGGVVILLFQGVGAQLPQDLDDPITQIVLPHWLGEPVAPYWIGGRFTRTIVSEGWPEGVSRLDAGLQWLQFVPLVAGQMVAILALMAVLKRGSRHGSKP